MSIWERFKRFFKRIGDAFKELIGIDTTDGPIDVETVTETVVDSDGNVVTTTTERKTNAPSWRDLGKKAKNKLAMSIDKFIDNPREALKKPAIITAAIAAGVKYIINPFHKMKERYEKKRRLYNDKTHLHYELKRPLKKYEMDAINRAQENNQPIGELLESFGVLY